MVLVFLITNSLASENFSVLRQLWHLHWGPQYPSFLKQEQWSLKQLEFLHLQLQGSFLNFLTWDVLVVFNTFILMGDCWNMKDGLLSWSSSGTGWFSSWDGFSEKNSLKIELDSCCSYCSERESSCENKSTFSEKGERLESLMRQSLNSKFGVLRSKGSMNVDWS